MSFEILEDISHELRRTAAGGISMTHVILDNIEFKVDTDRLFRKIHIDPNEEDGEQVLALMKKAEAIGSLKASTPCSTLIAKERIMSLWME